MRAYFLAIPFLVVDLEGISEDAPDELSVSWGWRFKDRGVVEVFLGISSEPLRKRPIKIAVSMVGAF